MERNVIEFLYEFEKDELVDRGILRAADRWLQVQSAEPLIRLMREHGVSKLEEPSRNWYLTSEGEFRNPRGREFKGGNISDPGERTSVFTGQNTYDGINPFCRRAEEGSEKDSEQTEGNSFGLERDLQSALRDNIEQLEPGLSIADGGKERTVQHGQSTGKIDITATDTSANTVVIELKPGKAPDSSLTQLLSYMAAVQQSDQCEVRGVLVARAFSKRLTWAAKAVPNVTLKTYSFQFTFGDP